MKADCSVQALVFGMNLWQEFHGGVQSWPNQFWGCEINALWEHLENGKVQWESEITYWKGMRGESRILWEDAWRAGEIILWRTELQHLHTGKLVWNFTGRYVSGQAWFHRPKKEKMFQNLFQVLFVMVIALMPLLSGKARFHVKPLSWNFF